MTTHDPRGPIAKTCLSDLSDLRLYRLRATVGGMGMAAGLGPGDIGAQTPRQEKRRQEVPA
jgi:hypothetical protein